MWRSLQEGVLPHEGADPNMAPQPFGEGAAKLMLIAAPLCTARTRVVLACCLLYREGARVHRPPSMYATDCIRIQFVACTVCDKHSDNTVDMPMWT